MREWNKSEMKKKKKKEKDASFFRESVASIWCSFLPLTDARVSASIKKSTKLSSTSKVRNDCREGPRLSSDR